MQSHQLYSIGHGSRKAEVFIELLQRYGIQYLVDVRSKPYSRFHPQFSRPVLEKSIQDHHMEYVFMGDELGGRPADPSCYDADGKIDYRILATKEFYKKGIERLQTAFDKQLPVALMCSERDPRMCHRCRLMGKTLSDKGIDVQHIDIDGNLVLQSELDIKPGKDLSPDLFT